MRLRLNGLETIKKLTRVDGLTLPGDFTKKKVNQPAMITQARRYGNPPIRVTLAGNVGVLGQPAC